MESFRVRWTTTREIHLQFRGICSIGSSEFSPVGFWVAWYCVHAKGVMQKLENMLLRRVLRRRLARVSVGTGVPKKGFLEEGVL